MDSEIGSFKGLMIVFRWLRRRRRRRRKIWRKNYMKTKRGNSNNHLWKT